MNLDDRVTYTRTFWDYLRSLDGRNWGLHGERRGHVGRVMLLTSERALVCWPKGRVLWHYHDHLEVLK